MAEKKVVIAYTEIDSFADLNPEDLLLVRAAEEGLKKAYAPYSHFHVGASVLLENGITVTGNNQENMAFPSSLCAERVAVFAATSSYPGVRIKAIAVVARSDDFPLEEAVTPCGGCRQALIEYENNQGSPIRVILASYTEKALILNSIADLLPLSFKGERLKKREEGRRKKEEGRGKKGEGRE
jgi:cytidine deaminase